MPLWLNDPAEGFVSESYKGGRTLLLNAALKALLT